jgi:hypothetical protein
MTPELQIVQFQGICDIETYPAHGLRLGANNKYGL